MLTKLRMRVATAGAGCSFEMVTERLYGTFSSYLFTGKQGVQGAREGSGEQIKRVQLFQVPNFHEYNNKNNNNNNNNNKIRRKKKKKKNHPELKNSCLFFSGGGSSGWFEAVALPLRNVKT